MYKITQETDNFDPIEEEKHEEFDNQSDIYKKVWPEVEEFRKTGELLELGKQIRCPVTVIHGDYDPHPYQNIKDSLIKVLEGFKFILLEKCGHTPWIERQARERFFEVLEYEIDQTNARGQNTIGKNLCAD